MNVPDNLLYTEEHEWVKTEGNTALIGITEYAASELGDIVFLDIDPDLDSTVAGEPFGTIEAVKTVSDLFAPVSGKVLEINPELADAPEKINDNAYDAWIIKVEMSDASELEKLLNAEAYSSKIG